MRLLAMLEFRMPLQSHDMAGAGPAYRFDDTVGGAVRHFDRDAYDELSHEISIEPGSRLARLFSGVARANVISIHHQSVKAHCNGPSVAG